MEKRYYYVKDYIDYTREEEEEFIEELKAEEFIEQDSTEEESFDYFIDLINEYQQEDIENFLYELDKLNGYFLLSGSIGKWYGARQGVKIVKNAEGIRDVISGYDGVSIYKEDNKVYIKLADHDGTSIVQLKVTTDYGTNYIYNLPYDIDCLSYEQINNMFNTNIYSKALKLSY